MIQFIQFKKIANLRKVRKVKSTSDVHIVVNSWEPKFKKQRALQLALKELLGVDD